LGDKRFKLTAIDPGTSSGVLSFNWLDPDNGTTTYANDAWDTTVVFDPVGTGIAAPATGTLDYTLQVVDPGLSAGWHFSSAEIDSDVVDTVDPSQTTVKKTINNGANILLTSTDGSIDGPVPIGGTLITVNDTWNVGQGDLLKSFNNHYTQSDVPGPLPLLGAGAAFGFSRRIRSRIKGVRLA